MWLYGCHIAEENVLENQGAGGLSGLTLVCCTLEPCLGQEEGPVSSAGLVASTVFGLRAPRHHRFSMLLRPVVPQFTAGSETGKYPRHDWVHGKLCLRPNILVIQVNINVCVKGDACPLGQSFDKEQMSQVWAQSAAQAWGQEPCGSPEGLSVFRKAALFFLNVLDVLGTHLSDEGLES